MTREECIQKIRHIQRSMYTFVFEDGKSHKFKADDADKFYYYLDMIAKYLDEDFIQEQKQKTGHWILTDDDIFVYCSECEDSYYKRPIDASWFYCPNCGAKMSESEEE